MTDTLTPRDPWLVLRAILETVPPVTHFSSASWHDEAVMAQLNSKQIGDAQDRAVEEGWLEPIGRWIDGQWSPNMTRATHAASKGRWVRLYVRTDTGWAPIAGQTALFEVA